MPSFLPPLSTTIYAEYNVYWLALAVGAGALCCGLMGYLIGYLCGRPKYIIIREPSPKIVQSECTK